ncbi:MAG: hypothetical protein J7K65_05840 [Planctomycetes bacterium]|nr:hypothetical protein [Planctomycetota bacterium]
MTNKDIGIAPLLRQNEQQAEQIRCLTEQNQKLTENNQKQRDASGAVLAAIMKEADEFKKPAPDERTGLRRRIPRKERHSI